MAAEDSVELARLGDGAIVIRVHGDVAEIVVDTGFVRGSLHSAILPEDLKEWQGVLDALDAGSDAAWRETFFVWDPDGERLDVTVTDSAASQTSVTVTVPVDDAWFDEAYARLDRVLTRWPV